MKPSNFDFQSQLLGENTQNPIPVHVDHLTGYVTACYELTDQEHEEIKQNGGKIYLSVAIPPGYFYPVAYIGPISPFRQLTPEELEQVQNQQKKERVKLLRANRSKGTKGKMLKMKGIKPVSNVR